VSCSTYLYYRRSLLTNAITDATSVALQALLGLVHSPSVRALSIQGSNRDMDPIFGPPCNSPEDGRIIFQVQGDDAWIVLGYSSTFDLPTHGYLVPTCLSI